MGATGAQVPDRLDPESAHDVTPSPQCGPSSNTTHDKCAGSGFEVEFGTLAASTIDSFDLLAAQCRDAGCSGGDDA